MGSGERDNWRSTAPIVRKKPKKKTTTYQAPSVIPGIRHIVEGMPKMTKTTKSYTGSGFTGVDPKRGISPRDVYEESGSIHTGANLGVQSENKASKSKYDAQVKRFQMVQAARSRIKPIADPEAGQADRRRTAARRRMRGRLGTLLTERQTLG